LPNAAVNHQLHTQFGPFAALSSGISAPPGAAREGVAVRTCRSAARNDLENIPIAYADDTCILHV